MKVAICDDNVEVLDFLEQEIRAKFNTHFSIYRYEDAGKLLEEWDDFPEKHTDIVIMDIKFQCQNGVDVAKQLQKLYGTHIKVIFITGYSEYVSEIFRAQPTFLLMKPISRELLYEALVKAEELIEEENEKAIYISFRGCVKRIKVKEIFYVESIGNKVFVYYIGGTQQAVGKLNEVEKRLPEDFLRIHKSFLVNMNYVDQYTAESMILTGGKELSVSRSKRKYVKEKFMEFLSKNT